MRAYYTVNIAQTDLSVAYIQQKYSCPYRIFGVLHKTCCVNIVTCDMSKKYKL